MTENEAIEELLYQEKMRSKGIDYQVNNLVIGGAVDALKEIQQYRAVGTIEECREAVERQKPKTPNIWGDGYDDEGNMSYDTYDCPNCGKSYETDYHDYKFCPECGQAIDRSNLHGT
ncbi:hypothetical protein [Hominifimenecus sp. rT4P-3]|uniref:hypothetical protein n=1 Tax=Hominifimenecus sp. rT4P-3 TaxID=3242979 RepID=UPI003DA200D1